MKNDIFNKATELSRSIGLLDQVIKSSDKLINSNFKSLFYSSLFILMKDAKFRKHFISFLKNEKKCNEEMFDTL